MKPIVIEKLHLLDGKLHANVGGGNQKERKEPANCEKGKKAWHNRSFHHTYFWLMAFLRVWVADDVFKIPHGKVYLIQLHNYSLPLSVCLTIFRCNNERKLLKLNQLTFKDTSIVSQFIGCNEIPKTHYRIDAHSNTETINAAYLIQIDSIISSFLCKATNTLIIFRV